MTPRELAEDLYGTLTLLEVLCEQINSEDTTVIKPSIKRAKQLADDLWYELIKEN